MAALGIWRKAALFAVLLASLPALADEPPSSIWQNLLENRTHVVGIELLIAEGTKDLPIYSRWGHTLIRFVMDRGDWTQDPVLAFLGDTPAKINNFKGLTGGYPIEAVFATFKDVRDEYVEAENRPLDRYVLMSTPELRQSLINTLQEWQQNPQKYLGNYYFLTRNCATLAENVLGQAGFPKKGLDTWIPRDVPGYFWKTDLDPFPLIQMKPSAVIYTKGAALLGMKESDLANPSMMNHWPSDSAKRLLSGLTPKELRLFLEGNIWMPPAIRDVLESDPGQKALPNDPNDVPGDQEVPTLLYQVCDSSSCAAEQAQAARETWPASALEDDLNKRIEPSVQWLLHPTRVIRDEDTGQLIEVPVKPGPFDLFEKSVILLANAEANPR